MRRTLIWRWAIATSLCAMNLANAQEAWPVVALPDTVSAFNVAEQMTANGLPMRLQGFVSKTKQAVLLDWFRKSLGQPLVENTLGNKQILGRAQGRYYVTVQIEAVAQGSKGLVAVTDIKTMAKNRESNRAATARWLNRLPAGSKIMSQMSSEDGGRLNTQLVVMNGHSESLNRDALVAIMRDDGYELKRETTQDDPRLDGVSDRISSNLRGSIMLVFNGNGKEAMATIHRNESGGSSLVFNTVIQMERYK